MRENIQAALLALPMELERIRSELQAGLSQFHNGNRVTGARYLPANRPLVSGGNGRLVGWSVRAAGGPVSLTLRDGRDGAGDVVAVLELAAGEDSTETLPGGGVSFGEALSAEVTGGGALQGAFYVGAVD